MSTPRPGSPLLRAFVRETLGCTCPDAVFDAVERTEGVAPMSRVSFARWVIGGRLLVYLLCAPAVSAETTRELAALGRHDRDAGGLNRFRLVLALQPDAAGANAAERAFAVATAGDPKAHLHCVAPARCESVLAAG